MNGRSTTHTRGIAIVAALVFAGAAALGGCAKPNEQTVTGRLVIGDERGYSGTSSCSGVDPIAFYQEGYKLRMQEGNGDQAKPIATATFSDGSVTSEGCEFAFEFKVRPGFDQYTVLACEPGQARPDCINYGFTWDEMRDQGFRFDWCIACSGSELNGGSAVDSSGNTLTD
jgi:hypothetical protein